MKDYSDENRMVLPSAEDVEMPTPEFIREIPQQVKHDFPLTTRIQGLLNVIRGTDHIPAFETVALLKECKLEILQAETNFKALSDGIDTFLERIDAIKEQAE